MRLALALLTAFSALVQPVAAADLAIVGAKIYPAPNLPAIEDGTVLIHNSKIAKVGRSADVRLSPGVAKIDARGAVLAAGFWNNHIHLMHVDLLRAERKPATTLDRGFAVILTAWGFTTAYELDGDLPNTDVLRRRIASGEVKGPLLLTVGTMFCPAGGTPIYIRDFVAENHWENCETSTPAEAAKRAAYQLDHGANGAKLMAGAYLGENPHRVLNLRLDIAKAVVDEAHKRGKPVFAHPQNLDGIDVAVDSGADVLAHATIDDGDWSPERVRRIRDHRMALIPTLMLFDNLLKDAKAPDEVRSMLVKRAISEVQAFHEAGGQILFGTDGGDVPLDPTKEYELMNRAGLDWREILASLTTAPSSRFGYSVHKGRIAKDMDADLVLLATDPSTDVSAFANVRMTIRGGRIIYERK
jgi:imidazolonepropionase-like amidohydrolase